MDDPTSAPMRTQWFLPGRPFQITPVPEADIIRVTDGASMQMLPYFGHSTCSLFLTIRFPCSVHSSVVQLDVKRLGSFCFQLYAFLPLPFPFYHVYHGLVAPAQFQSWAIGPGLWWENNKTPVLSKRQMSRQIDRTWGRWAGPEKVSLIQNSRKASTPRVYLGVAASCYEYGIFMYMCMRFVWSVFFFSAELQLQLINLSGKESLYCTMH